MILTDEEAELSNKVYNLVKDLEGLVEMYVHSDGIHDRGGYSLHFSKYADSIVLFDIDRAHEKGYIESWREESEKRRKAHEMYELHVHKQGLEVHIPADSSRTIYILPDKIKNYFSQKLPGATFSQRNNIFRWGYDSPKEFEKIINSKTT